MNRKHIIATFSVNRSIALALRIVRSDIKTIGWERAYEKFMSRSTQWIESHDGITTSDPDEAVAIAAFSAALSFINVLWVTGEIDANE